MTLPLLQSVFFRTQTDIASRVFFSLIVAAVILGVILYNRKNFGGRPGRRVRYNRRLFRKDASAIGLSKRQRRLLESLIQRYKVRQPSKLLSRSQELRKTLGRALQDIKEMKAKASVIEGKKLNIYKIQQQIDRHSASAHTITSTKQLRLGQNITLQQENDNRFLSNVTANLKDFFCAQAPANYGGKLVKARKGTKITVFIWGIDDEEWAFESRILGYTTVKRVPSVILQHANRVDYAVQRKYKRRVINEPCSFCPVHSIETKVGRKTIRKAEVKTNQAQVGTIINLSTGGCALVCGKNSLKDKLLRVTIDPLHGDSIVVFGKIVRNRTYNPYKTILHIVFTKMSNENVIRINKHVYGFG